MINQANHFFSSLLFNLRSENIVIFHVGRVGSTVLLNMLNHHKNIYSFGEFWHPKNLENTKNKYADTDSLKLFESESIKAGFKKLGVVIKFHPLQDLRRIDLSLNELTDYLFTKNFKKVIIIERKNQLKRFVSDMIGSKRGKWHDTTKPGVTTIQLNIEEFSWFGVEKPLFAWFAEIDETYASLRNILKHTNIEHLDLIYENDIEESPKMAYLKICDFLKIKPKNTIYNKYVKSNPYSLSEVILNYDDIYNQFIGSKYEWMIDN